MKHWLFQGNPARWRIFDYLRDHGAQSFRTTEWSVSRHLGEISPGDGAVLWIAGDPRTRGAYGVGRVASEPYRETSGDEYWTDPADRLRSRWFVDLELPTLLFDEPILATDLRADPRFAGASILRMPRGGNPHRLAKEEWRAILDQCPGERRPQPNAGASGSGPGAVSIPRATTRAAARAGRGRAKKKP